MLDTLTYLSACNHSYDKRKAACDMLNELIKTNDLISTNLEKIKKSNVTYKEKKRKQQIDVDFFCQELLEAWNSQQAIKDKQKKLNKKTKKTIQTTPY